MFAKDEKALCFHHELLYEAKVLDVKLVDPNDKKSAYQYKVHYKGWKATWDDWVPQDRLRKLNDENRELANNLKKELESMRRGSLVQKPASTSHKKKADVGSTRGSEGRETPVASTSLAGRKRGRDFEVERLFPLLCLLCIFLLSSTMVTTRRAAKSEGLVIPEIRSPQADTRPSKKNKSAQEKKKPEKKRREERKHPKKDSKEEKNNIAKKKGTRKGDMLEMMKSDIDLPMRLNWPTARPARPTGPC
ncbi:Chromo domain/shadow [Macrophomina phaseolina MS6]|uniref:Chromatin modification-related protein EAF3 n=1 Tax=Macrophomina phaseolina (strain MS6) TaxID=1126212 RepID=K2R9L3_MACPH|nr:Chromo domain/shadow [Macrophomina phaseolina MS6]